MEHREDPLDKLIDVGDLVQMPVAMIAEDTEDAQTEEVGGLTEHIGQLQGRGIDQDRERVLLEQLWEPNQGLALFTDPPAPQSALKLAQGGIGVQVRIVARSSGSRSRSGSRTRSG